MTSYQIPPELIQLDPGCISRLRAESSVQGEEGEEGEEEERGRKGGRKTGGKSEALKRRKRREDRGRVRRG